MRWRSYTSDGYEKLLKGAVQPVVPAARITKAALQAIATSTLTAIAFDTETFDTDAMHDPATNPSRFTCRTAGKYLLRGVIAYSAGATGIRDARIRLNGTTDIGFARSPNAGAADAPFVNVSVVYDLAVGDYVELLAYHEQGASLNALASTYAPAFEVVYLGPGIMGSGGIGERELAYAEITASASITSTVETVGDLIVAAPALTFDGKTTIEIEFFAPALAHGTVGAQVFLELFDNGVNSTRLTRTIIPTASQPYNMGWCKRRLTPSAGSHAFSIRGAVSAGTGSVLAGTGLAAPGAEAPAFIKIKRVS